MKKLVGVVVVLLAIAFGVSMVYADTPAKGFYFGAGASYSWEDFRNTDGLDVDNAGGFGFYGGYQVMRYLALEANYDWHADFDLKYNGTRIGSISDLQTFMVDAKGMYPIGLVASNRRRSYPAAEEGSGRVYREGGNGLHSERWHRDKRISLPS